MTFGYVPLGEDDVISLHSTDGDLGSVELKALRLTTFFGDQDGEHIWSFSFASGPFGPVSVGTNAAAIGGYHTMLVDAGSSASRLGLHTAASTLTNYFSTIPKS